MADLGMHAVGEINRRGAVRQLDDPSFRRHDIDVRLKDILLQRIHVFVRIVAQQIAGQCRQIAEPRQLLFDFSLFLMRIILRTFLVAPVRRNAHLGDAVHFLSADLNLKNPSFVADDRRVQRLVHVRFRHRDIVL